MAEAKKPKALPKFEIDAETDCWRWTGRHTENGYGLVDIDGKVQRVHRVMHELFIGPIPDGLHVDHVHERGCRYRDCGNPAHLEAVTQAENNRRAGVLKTHCPRGHEYTPDNTYRQPSKPNARICRACRSEFNHEARPKVAANA